MGPAAFFSGKTVSDDKCEGRFCSNSIESCVSPHRLRSEERTEWDVKGECQIKGLDTVGVGMVELNLPGNVHTVSKSLSPTLPKEPINGSMLQRDYHGNSTPIRH